MEFYVESTESVSDAAKTLDAQPGNKQRKLLAFAGKRCNKIDDVQKK